MTDAYTSGAGTISLADAEARAALLPLLHFIAEEPGGEYPVIFIGPLASGDMVRREMETVCLPRGVRVGRASDQPAPEVVLCGAAEAAPALEALGRDRCRQVVIWSTTGMEGVAPEVAVLLSGAFVFDLREFADLASSGWSLAPTLARAAASPGQAANPVVVAGLVDTLGLLATEAQMRLGVRGVEPIDLVSASDLVAGDPFPDHGPGAAVIVRAGSLDDDVLRRAMLDALRVWVERGVQVVLVGEPSTRDALVCDPAWAAVAARAAVVMAADEIGFGAEGEGLWPALADVLPAAPKGTPDVEAAAYPLGTYALASVLELAESRLDNGTIIVYAADRLGWMRVVRDQVLDARRLGDEDAPAAPDLVTARVREMGTWTAGSVLVVPGAAPATAATEGIGLSMLAFDLTRLADERDSGREVPLDPRVAARAPLAAHQVAGALLGAGLSTHALALLRGAEGGEGWRAEDDVLLGLLLAEGDAQGASARLRRALFHMSGHVRDFAQGAVQIDATLAVLLLEVRAQQMHPQAAWETVAGWLERHSAGWVDSGRRAAVVAELALRAGQADAARYFLSGVAHYYGEGHTVSRLLSERLSEAPA